MKRNNGKRFFGLLLALCLLLSFVPMTAMAKAGIGSITVRFSPGNHGTLSGTTEYTGLGFMQKFPQAPTVTPDPGWTFLNWEPLLPSRVLCSYEYTARYLPILYNVHFRHTEGGYLEGCPLDFDHCLLLYGADFPDAPEPVACPGYAFVGWSPSLPTTVTTSGTYTAVFKRLKTVSFAAGEHGTLVGQTSYTLPEGSPFPTPPGVNADSGWTWTGWEPVLPASVVNTQTYTAKYTKNSYSVTFQDGGHGTLDGQALFSGLEHNAAFPTAPSVTADDGYRFTGWSPGLPGTVTESGTYTATYAAIHTIAFSPGGHGTLSGTTEYTLANGSPFPTAPSVTAEPGWSWTGWEPVLPATVTQSATYAAQYVQCSYSVTFEPGMHGTLSGTTSFSGFSYGDAFPAAPAVTADSGWKFNGWSPLLPASVNQSATYTAQYVPLHTVTFESGVHGTLSGDTLYVLAEGSDFPSPPDVVPTVGYYFTGWSPVLPDGVTQTQTYTAQYETEKFTVTFASSGPGHLEGTTSFANLPYDVIFDTSVTVPTPVADSGAYFVGWSPDFPMSVTDNLTFTAVFAAKTTLTLVADSNTVTYDGNVHGISTFSGVPTGLTVTGVSVSGGGTNVGIYAITFSNGDVRVWNGNTDVTEQYSLNFIEGRLTVNPKAATITVADNGKVYGETDPALTAVVTGMAGTETLDYSVNRAAGENAGTYNITATCASNANYTVTVVDGTFTISPKAATITVADNGKVYGETDPALTAVVTGMTGTDTLDYSVKRAAGENAGTYGISATYTPNANYAVSVVDGTFTLSPKAAAITVDDKTKTYGDADPALTAIVTGLVGTDTLNYSLTRDPGNGVGNYTIDATLTPNANYSVNVIGGSLTIVSKAVTITVDDQTKTRGQADPVFTATVAGVVGDEEAVYSLNRVAGEGVGSYVISAKVSATAPVNANYSFTVIDGVLTIVAPAVVPQKTQPAPTATPTVIPGPVVPTGGPAGPTWALLNLILALGSGLAALALLIGYINKRRIAGGGNAITRLFGLVPGIGGIIAFLLTENMNNPMAIVDNWTPLMIVIALVMGAVAYMASRKPQSSGHLGA